jgi:hypothetical protein
MRPLKLEQSNTTKERMKPLKIEQSDATKQRMRPLEQSVSDCSNLSGFILGFVAVNCI